MFSFCFCFVVVIVGVFARREEEHSCRVRFGLRAAGSTYSSCDDDAAHEERWHARGGVSNIGIN